MFFPSSLDTFYLDYLEQIIRCSDIGEELTVDCINSNSPNAINLVYKKSLTQTSDWQEL